MTHDGQSTFERTYMTLMAGFAGANVLVGAGMIQQSLVISHEQLVIDSEINNTVIKSLEGITVDQDRLGVDAITRVGPGGHFVADPHTLRFLRAERYEPSLLYRDSREAWETRGSTTFVERAREKAEAILAEHEINALPEDIGRALDAYVSATFKSLK
jgi:trimethylamine--corrinoid protein Co-methyltransferase